MLRLNKLPRAKRATGTFILGHRWQTREQGTELLGTLHLRRPKNIPYLMISWWPPLLAGHSHKLTTSWFWLSSPSQCAPTSQAENLLTTRGSGPGHMHTLFRACSERTGREGKELFWAPFVCQAGCQTHLLKGSWAPNLFLIGPFWLYLYLKKNTFYFVLLCIFLNLSPLPCVRGTPNWQLHQLQREPALPTSGEGALEGM